MIKPIEDNIEYDDEFNETIVEEAIAAGIEKEMTSAPDRHEALIRLTNHFFEPEGQLSKSGLTGRNYEFRLQQMKMAMATAEALKNNHNLCVEAPTGVGKSFAYLVPAIHYAANESNPVVISTETDKPSGTADGKRYSVSA